MPRVYLSLGSNIDRERHLRACLDALANTFGELNVSTVYECPAVGFSGDPFYNLVVGLETDWPLARLATWLRELEAANGRVRGSEKFAARTLDVDILTYGDATGDVDGLQLPRDEIDKYAFVLGPLAEIAGDAVHPVKGRSYAELWQAMASAQTTPLQPVNFPWP